MGKVVTDITVSLDGLITGADDDLELIHAWLFSGTDAQDKAVIEAFTNAIGAVIMGRGTFNDGVKKQGWVGRVDTPPFAVPMFVLAHDVPEALTEGKTAFTFVTGGIEEALAQAKAAAGDKTVIIMGGANMIQQYVNAGLLDEIHIHLVPLLLGEGKRLFDHLTVKNVKLEQTGVIVSEHVTHIRYRIIKEN